MHNDLIAFIAEVYSVPASQVTVSLTRVNPHYTGECNDDGICRSPQYDVQAECHPGHVITTLHDVIYDPNYVGYNGKVSPAGALVAESECGQFSVWMD